MPENQKNCVAVITGSAGGLGKGIAERLARDGFKIVLSDINEDALAKTEQEFKDAGHGVLAVKADVSSRDDRKGWSRLPPTSSVASTSSSTMPASNPSVPLAKSKATKSTRL